MNDHPHEISYQNRQEILSVLSSISSAIERLIIVSRSANVPLEHLLDNELISQTDLNYTNTSALLEVSSLLNDNFVDDEKINNSIGSESFAQAARLLLSDARADDIVNTMLLLYRESHEIQIEAQEARDESMRTAKKIDRLLALGD